MIDLTEFGVALAAVVVLALTLCTPSRTRAVVAAVAGGILAFVVGIAWSRHRKMADEQEDAASDTDEIIAALGRKEDGDIAVFDKDGHVSSGILEERL